MKSIKKILSIPRNPHEIIYGIHAQGRSNATEELFSILSAQDGNVLIRNGVYGNELFIVADDYER